MSLSVLESAASSLEELLVKLVAQQSSFGKCPTLLDGAQNSVSFIAGNARFAERVVVVQDGLTRAFHFCNCGCRHSGLVGKDEAIECTFERRTENHATAEEDDEEEGGVDESQEEARLDGSSHVWRQSDDGSYAEENGDDASDDEHDGSDDKGAEELRHFFGRRALEGFDTQLSVLTRICNHACDGFVFVVEVKHGCCFRFEGIMCDVRRLGSVAVVRT